MTMHARVVRAVELEPVTVASWGRLHEHALEQNPFFEPPCVLTAARHLPDGDRIEVLLAEEGDTVLGCLPLKSLPRWHWSRRGTATSRVRRLTWLGTPLLDRARADEAMAVMLAHLRHGRRRSGNKLLAIEWMHAGGPAEAALRRAAARLHLPLAVGEEFERSAIAPPLGADTGLLVDSDPGGDTSSVRDRFEPLERQRTTRRKLQKLVADHAGTAVKVDRSGAVAAVRDVIALEAGGYKGRAGIALANWSGEPEWFEEMVADFAAAGRVLVTSLTTDGRIIAAIVVVTAGDDAFFCLTAYDEEYAFYAPGIQLRYDTVDLLRRTQRIRRADTCTYADNDVRQELFPDSIRVATFLVGLGSPVEHALLAALPTAQRCRARVRARRPTPDA